MANSDVSGNLKMRPRARLISLIGDELISDENVAVVELVKNAFDADAESVTVKFEVDDSHQPIRLIISDDGHGMSLDAVMNGWFEPGTIMKKKNSRSPGKKRLYQGAKGVGRFAAARLGTELFLETKEKNANFSTTVLLEWGSFDDDSYLDEVEITYEKSNQPSFKKGTVLTIEGLHKKKLWVEDDFINLQNRLSRLLSPFLEVDDFEIDLIIPNYPELTGKVEAHSITKKPVYELKGSITNEGEINAIFLHKGEISKNINKNIAGKGEKVKCGKFEFEIRAWDRDRAGLTPYMVEYDLNITGIRNLLNSYCGVSIYRDGFRVHPYGEKGDDWLSLDTRSRQTPTLRLANNQVISSIKISRDSNPNLKDRTTREGLVFNEDFEHLKKWFLSVLTVLEEERYKLRPREDSKPEYVSTIFEAFDMTDVVQLAKEDLGNKHPLTKKVKEKDVEIRDGIKKLQEHYSRILLAAGLGQLVDLVIHEIGAPLGKINREITYLVKLISGEKEWMNDNEEILTSFTKIQSWLEQIGSLRARLDPKTAGKRGRATSFNVEEEILANLNLYENLISKQKIGINFIRPKEPIVVHMSRSNLGQIIANLLDNSIFWICKHHGSGKGGNIEITLNLIKNGFSITFSDDGPGISEENVERIFEQNFSTKPNGMGLGLFIAREVIEQYGRIIYKDNCELPGACFEANFIRKIGW